MEEGNNKFHKAIIISSAVHLVLAILFFLSPPSFFKPIPENKDIVTFDVVNFSDIPNIKSQNQKNGKVDEEKKSREVKKSTKIEKTPTYKPKKPVKQQQATPTPAQEIQKVQENKNSKTPIAEVKKENAKTRSKPTAPPKQTIEEDSIDSKLKNLEKESTGSDPKAKTANNVKQNQDKYFTQSDEYMDDYPLSITEELYIKSQIQKHWNIPVGIDNLDEVVITLRVQLKKNGHLKDIITLHRVCPANHSTKTCMIIEQSVLRAARTASPYKKLVPERYDSWKSFKIEVKPGDFY
jgi:outer membrane biosynthesis protein TonB